VFDWIPLQNYTAIHYHLLLVICFIVLLHSTQFTFYDEKTRRFATGFGVFLVVFMCLYMGTRPVSGRYFTDMGTYAKTYRLIQEGQTVLVEKDFIFNYFMIACTKLMSERWFFFLCALIYTIPCYLFARKYCGTYWFYVFFMLVGSFSFWAYGTNGIRNGMATSLFLLALCYYNRKYVLYPLLALSFGIHSSMIIPIAAFLISSVYKDPKIYIYIWLAAIPLSLAGGSFWESFFGGLGFGDDTRAEDYLTKGNINNDNFSSTGFRWDFLLYSASAVFAGWYFIFQKKITDVFYIHLWGTFLIANAFWILVIRANFSNRFAYVSWFLMAAVIAYPMLRYKIWKDQYKTVAMIMFVYFMFTYFMNVIKG